MRLRFDVFGAATECDNDNRKLYTWCNNIVSYEFLSIRNGACDYILFNSYCCVLFSCKVMVRIRFRVVLFNGYAHVFVLLSVVIVTLPSFGGVDS